MKNWVAFYDSAHSIYVNARHRDIHYARLADEIARYVPAPSAAVLDYGCGEALHADRIAAVAERLVLAEAAPKVRNGLLERFKHDARITVISADCVASLPESSFDLVVMHSVSQYLTGAEFDRIAAVFFRLLKPGGVFLVGDVVTPNTGAFSDAIALLGFGWRDGFLVAAILGLVRTLFSEYWQLRSQLGLTRYSEAQMLGRLDDIGFSTARAPANLGHLQTRMTFLACKPSLP
jgi:SAM-dependent methyltransferase